VSLCPGATTNGSVSTKAVEIFKSIEQLHGLCRRFIPINTNHGLRIAPKHRAIERTIFYATGWRAEICVPCVWVLSNKENLQLCQHQLLCGRAFFTKLIGPPRNPSPQQQVVSSMQHPVANRTASGLVKLRGRTSRRTFSAA